MTPLYDPKGSEFKPAIDPARCRHAVHDATGFHQCGHRWSIRRGGVGYCAQHDPHRAPKKRAPTKFELELIVCDLNEQAHRIARAVVKSKDPRFAAAVKRYQSIQAKLNAARNAKYKK